VRLGTNYAVDDDSFGLVGTIPASISNMNQLLRLELNQNRLSGVLPSQHGSMSFLKFYDVSNNAMLGGSVPEEFAQMSNLEGLSIFGTSIEGVVPSGLCELEVFIEVDCVGAGSQNSTSNATTGGTFTSVECSCCDCPQ
jgi:hypothetical protein